MRKSSIITALICISVFSFSSCGGSQWTEPFPDRMPISISDSIGVEYGDSCMIFGSISDADFSPSGEIFVLDQVACCIREYSADGHYLRTLSRHGSGPGEMLYPSEIAIFQNGNIMVRDQGRSCLMLIDRDGAGIREFPDWSLFLPPEAITAVSTERFAGYQPSINQNGDDILIVFKPATYSIENGERVTEFTPDSLWVKFDEMASSLNGLQGMCTMASDGERVFYARRSTEEYQVDCWDTSGTPQFTFRLNIPRSEKNEEEIRQETEYAGIRLASLGGSLPEGFAPDPYNNLVKGIGLDSHGNLWIQRGTEAGPVFDVVNSQGEQIATAEFPRVGKFWKFSITPHGSLAWNQDPVSGVQRLYILQLPEID